jgi:ATP-dependent DNA helicase DinG
MAASLPYPALYATHGGIWMAHGDGRVEGIGRGEAIARAAETPLIMLNAPLVGQRLGYPELSGLDLLELFAFLHPGRFAVPTPKGLAHALEIEAPESDAEAAPFLLRAAGVLLEALDGEWPEREGAWASAQALYRLRWTWAPVVAERLRRPERDERWLFSRLPEWEESGGRPQPRTVRIDPTEAVERLAGLTGQGAETREGQRDYSAAAAGRVRAARRGGAAQFAACGGGDGDRQDARLSRPGFSLGRQGGRDRVGLDLHQGAAAAARP